ncbi:hypothetical protein [Brevundimonas naejangsanensis]|uniref:hypothetical protein n=1 Tax=Brevundimonas naejangsanensis TaxID=588932 RepID=UPI00320791AC
MRSHLKRNPASRLLRYGAARRPLAAIARHPLLCSTMLALIYAGALVAAWLAPPLPWGPQSPGGVGDYFRDFQTINLALMGAQATLLGLVYPLVIALVSLLFQETTARGARLNVYFKETEVAVVGGTALVFVAVVGAQSVFYGQAPVRVVAAMTVINILWFVANLGGLAFFVLSSLEFVRPAGRHRMMESYLANTAWPAQFLATVRSNRLLGAQTYGYIDEPLQAGAVGLINPYEFDPPIFKRILARPRTLSDVAFGRLNAVLSSQKRGAAHGRAPATLTFSPSIDTDYPAGSVALVRGAGALCAAERFVLQRAYRFKRPRRKDDSSLTQDLLTELVASAHAQFEAGSFEGFDVRIEEAFQLHVRLFELGANPRTPETGAFNYASIEEGWDSLGMSWVAAYRALLQRAGDRIDREPRFFERLIHIPARLHRRIRPVAPPEARRSLFHLAAVPVLALLDRAGQEKADAAPVGAPPPTVFDFPGAAGEKYKRFWVNYVGGWEGFGEALGSLGRREGEPLAWDDLSGLTTELFRHLSDTALLAARAAQIGETQAIGWTVDMLIKWRGRTVRRLVEDHGSWALHRPLLTLRHARMTWPEIEAAPLTLQDQPKSPGGVFGAVMDNVWFDTVVMTLATLMARCPGPVSGAIPDSGARRAALALYHNRMVDPGGAAYPVVRPMEFGALLRSLLRRADRATGYGADIDALSERIGDLDRSAYVSGRVYSWSGLGGGDVSADPQILLLAATIALTAGRRRGVFDIGDDTRRLLLPEGDQSRRRVLDHLQDFSRRATEADRPLASALLSMLLERVVDIPETEVRITAVLEILAACRAEIEAVRLIALQNAEVDPERLAAVEAKIAETAFTPSGFPLDLFQQVERVQQPLRRFTFRVNGLRRGVYTRPQLEDPYSDGDEYLRQHYTPVVASRVLLDALETARFVRRSPRSGPAWWRSVKDGVAAVRAAGLTPLIIRSAHNEPVWLRDWHYDQRGRSRPADMLLERRDGQGGGYDFHLNETPVYSDIGAGDVTWIVAREMFARVEFEDFGDGRMVTAALTVDPTDPWRASLSLEWGRAVTLAEAPTWRVSHPSR